MGHFLVYANSELKNLGWKLMAYANTVDKNLTMEKFFHMDIEGETSKIFAIGWSLALLTDLYYANNNIHKKGEEEVKAVIAHEVKKIQNTENSNYRHTITVLQDLVLG